MKVVPDPSERWTGAIALSGRFMPGLSCAISGSFHFCDLAEIDVGEGLAVELELARLDALQIDDRHDAAHHHRPLRETVLLAAARLSAACRVAPKSTVLAVICLMPPPEPIDW